MLRSIVAVALILFAGHATAQQSGGFPSRPKFQSVTIAGNSVWGEIRCTSACSPAAINVGQTVTVYKGLTTSRASTIVQAADPDLQVTFPNSGLYEVRACLRWNAAALGTQGIRVAFNRTSAGSNGFAWMGTAAPNPGTLITASGAGSPGGTTSRFTVATISVSSAADVGCFSGILLTSSGIGYAVEWAQNTSDANATQLLLDSWISFKRIN